MHNEIFSDGFIGDLRHHSIDSLAAEVIQRWILLDLFDAGIDQLDESFNLANVTGHKRHVDGFRVRLLFDVEAAFLESVCKFVAAEVSAFKGNNRRIRLSNQLKFGVGLKILNKLLDLHQYLCRNLPEAVNAQIQQASPGCAQASSIPGSKSSGRDINASRPSGK